MDSKASVLPITPQPRLSAPPESNLWPIARTYMREHKRILPNCQNFNIPRRIMYDVMRFKNATNLHSNNMKRSNFWPSYAGQIRMRLVTWQGLLDTARSYSALTNWASHQLLQPVLIRNWICLHTSQWQWPVVQNDIVIYNATHNRTKHLITTPIILSTKLFTKQTWSETLRIKITISADADNTSINVRRRSTPEIPLVTISLPSLKC